MTAFLRAVSNDKRLQILEWLAAPRDHFEPQVDGDLEEDGVCLARIVDKLGLAQPTVTAHMRILVEAELVTSRPIKNWVFYKLRRDRLDVAIDALAKRLGSSVRG